jgi:hypothetical protein
LNTITSLLALYGSRQRCRLEKWIHCRGNWVTVGYTSKRWYSQLREIRRKDKKEDNIRKIKWLEFQKASSGMWNASLWQQFLYQIFFVRSVLVWLSIWRTWSRPSLNNSPGSTNSTSSGRWCLHILALIDSTSHIPR